MRILLAAVPVVAIAAGAAALEATKSSAAKAACVQETQPLRGYPGGLATGPDGKLWFSEQLNDRVGSFDPTTGKVTEIQLPKGTLPHYVAAAPDGNIWFSSLPDKMGMVDPKTGKVTILTAGISPASVPHAIAAAPDGSALYFTEQEGGRLGRIDLRTHKITEISAGLPPVSRPHGIAVDPDQRHLWVALQAAGAIARFDLQTQRFDKLVHFDAESGPHDLHIGPDGHTLYVTLQLASKIGTYDLSTGAVHEYATPLPPPTVTDLEPGAKLVDVIPSARGDHAVWITTFAADRLLRFDTESKQITQVTCGIGAGHGTLEIKLGPDGDLWFTEPLGRRLARLNE
jgi:streptogramin lyase